MKIACLRAAAVVVAALLTGAAAAAAPALDEYGGRRDIWGHSTGFFHLEKIRDRWWFITPAGNVFLARCVDVVNPVPGETAAQLGERLTGWGFNTLGPRAPAELSGLALRRVAKGLAYTIALDLSRPAIAAGASIGREFPDVFDPRFEAMADEAAARLCPAYSADPWLLGYFTDDGLEWRANGPQDLVAAFFAMPAECPGKRALVGEIRARYRDDLGQLNRAWDLSLASWEQLQHARELSPGARLDGPRVSADRSALLALIARRYFEVVSAAVRRYDPQHLLLGCRFAQAPAREVVAAMRGQMDAASIAWNGESAAALTQLHSDSGLPLLVMPLDLARGAIGGEAQAAAYRESLEELAKQGFVVGYAWPRYSDANARAQGPELVSARGEPHRLLTTRVERANERFYVQAAFARLKPTLFEVVERYELRRCAAMVRADGDLKDWASAMPMELRPSAYEHAAAGITATAYLMWDAGVVYFAGRLTDPALRARTLTSFIGGDWLELAAGPYRFEVTLRPGAQTVTDNKQRTRKARLALARIAAPAEEGQTLSPRRIIGYTFEGAVKVSGIIPEGFVFQFGLALHHYGCDRREVTLSFPSHWYPGDPESSAYIIVTAPAPP